MITMLWKTVITIEANAHFKADILCKDRVIALVL